MKKQPHAYLSMSKKRKASVNDDVSALSEALSKREKELDAREEKLQQDFETREKEIEAREEKIRQHAEHTATFGETSSSDVLHLNVGGTKTTVLRRTLTAVAGSMLASRFSGRWDDSIEKDKDGDFFIDQDFFLFDILLNYLRNKANGEVNYPIKAPDLRKLIEEKGTDGRDNFYRMVEYYGMTDDIYPTELYGSGSGSTLAKMLGPKKAEAKERYGTVLVLAPVGHSRSVKTFEVTLGKVEKIKIGWGLEPALTGNTSRDTAYVQYFLLLDLTGSSYTANKLTTKVDDGFEHSEGTIVRSENYGKIWYINGELVVPSFSEKWDWAYSRCKAKMDRDYNSDYTNQFNMMPFIDFKGEIEVTYVELCTGEIEEKFVDYAKQWWRGEWKDGF